MNNHYIANVIEDPDTGDHIVQFPPELAAQLNWQVGDSLEYEVLNGKIFISNKSLEENKIYIVETISTHKIRYAIRGKSLEHAMDTVTCEEAPELDQEYLGETIFGGKEVTQKEFLEKEIKNEYMVLSPEIWTEEKKLQLIHKIDYKK